MIRCATFLLVIAAAGCTPTPPTPQEAADRCEQRARDAQAPNVGLTIGANSNSGPFASANIGLTSDLLRGSDPLALYESCVINLTGEPPIRPARLRVL